MGQYVQADTSLPISLDVNISVTQNQSAQRTNLSVLCVVGSALGLLPDATRIRFYSGNDVNSSGLSTDFAAGTDIYNAATAFFAQSPRATTMAVAQAFTTATQGMMIAAALTPAQITALAAITTGSMNLTVGGVSTDVLTMNFTGVTTLAQIATVIQGQLTAAGVAAACSVLTLPGGAQYLQILTTATGATATVTFPTAAASGVNVGGMLNLTAAAGGKILQGYLPTGMAGELDNIKSAANAAGTNVYGWCFTAPLRDTTDQQAAATWASGQTAIMYLVSNDVGALDPSYLLDIGYLIDSSSNKRVRCIYHNDPNQYPDVSILAFMLGVNYQAQNSTVVPKFKQLPGIPTVPLTSTQWQVLEAKGYDSYTASANSTQTYRDGGTEDPSYWVDSVINLDNFVDDLGVALLNVFLMNGKVAYTRPGVALLTDACNNVGTQYVYNGTFADRDIPDPTQKSGYSTLPAVAVVPTPIQDMSVTDRAGRVGPPITMVVQLSDAIQSVAINVQAVQ